MSIDITVDDVKAIAPNLGATDAAIELQIKIATCKLDGCLEANYADCPEIAEAIKIYVVAHFSYQTGTSSGNVTSRKWSDGASEGYDQSRDAKMQYWDNALALDSANCVANAYRSGKVFAVTGSAVKSYRCAQ